MLSGIYVIGTPQPGEPEHVYYGPNPGPEVSSLPGLLDTTVPLLFSVAERDPARFQQEAAGVVSAWLAQHGTVPDLVWVEGHNHMSTIGSLTVDEAALGTALARFVDRNTTTMGR
jgi:triacylglycerol lipase